MQKLEIVARSAKQALQKASKKFDLPLEELSILEEYDPDEKDIELLETEEKEDPSLVTDDEPILFIISASLEKSLGKIREWIEELISHFQPNCRVELITHDDSITAVIHAEDPSILIGKQGQTLEALQHVASRVLPRLVENIPMVFLDVGDYREKRLEKLEEMADRAVNRALRTKRSVKLRPMSSQDRKYVHHYLKDVKDIETSSYGVDPYRYLEIELPNEKNRGRSSKGERDNRDNQDTRGGDKKGRGPKKGKVGRVTKKIYDDAAEKDQDGNYIFEKEDIEAPKKLSIEELLTKLPADEAAADLDSNDQDSENDRLVDELE